MNCSNALDLRNLQQIVRWYQNFCKFSAFSLNLEFFKKYSQALEQFFSQKARTILVTKYHFSKNWQKGKWSWELQVFLLRRVSCLTLSLNYASVKLVSESHSSVNIPRTEFLYGAGPSFRYSYSISHILDHEFFCYGCLDSSGHWGKKNTILEFLSYFSWAENKIHFFKILLCPRKKMHDMYFFNKFYIFKIFIPLKLSNLSLKGRVIL